jgi:hypothetical protein
MKIGIIGGVSGKSDNDDSGKLEPRGNQTSALGLEPTVRRQVFSDGRPASIGCLDAEADSNLTTTA